MSLVTQCSTISSQTLKKCARRCSKDVLLCFSLATPLDSETGLRESLITR
jgi:hypothetical protein